MTPPLTESELLECADFLRGTTSEDEALVHQLQAMQTFQSIMFTNLMLLEDIQAEFVIQGIMATWLQIGMEIGRRRAEARTLEGMVGL